MKLKIVIAFFLYLGIIFYSCRSSGPHNPYLDLKDKPSEKLKAGHSKATKRANRIYKRTSKKNQRRIDARARRSSRDHRFMRFYRRKVDPSVIIRQ